MVKKIFMLLSYNVLLHVYNCIFPAHRFSYKKQPYRSFLIAMSYRELFSKVTYSSIYVPYGIEFFTEHCIALNIIKLHAYWFFSLFSENIKVMKLFFTFQSLFDIDFVIYLSMRVRFRYEPKIDLYKKNNV